MSGRKGMLWEALVEASLAKAQRDRDLAEDRADHVDAKVLKILRREDSAEMLWDAINDEDRSFADPYLLLHMMEAAIRDAAAAIWAGEPAGDVLHHMVGRQVCAVVERALDRISDKLRDQAQNELDDDESDAAGAAWEDER